MNLYEIGKLIQIFFNIMLLKRPSIIVIALLASCHVSVPSSQHYKTILNDIERREANNQLHLENPLASKYYESMKLCLERMSTSKKKDISDANHLLWMSTKVDEPAIALVAVQSGADVNHNYMSACNGILTPLMEAVSSDSVKTAQLLINNGANMKLKNKEGQTLKYLAYSQEMLKLIESNEMKGQKK